ncbi:hypothetical protein [Aestuariivirga sp.]|uniref:hypothetical protein n=1 Tax=Aestuariivirga sp. TaxID=2650926 RepID=UPI0039E477E1
MYALGVGLRGAQPLTEAHGLSDPLRTVSAIARLIDEGQAIGYTFKISSDFAALARERLAVRNSAVSPMFDITVSRELGETGFWLSAHNAAGETVGIQAFRLDDASPNLADWVLGWMMGLYAKRREMIVPNQLHAPDHSLAALIRGKAVYHGELWIEKHSKGCFNVFPRLGMLLALVKWQPDAIWALTGDSMATRGHLIRMGYGHLEPSFLTWDWEPEGAEPHEWIAIAERRHLEFCVAEMAINAEAAAES